jgi:hypothetical protein
LSVARLVEAQTEDEIEDAYWQLDNHVVVQGQVLESALPLVPVLLALLLGELSSSARVRVLDLLFEIYGSSPHERELEARNTGISEACSLAVAEGKWIYYQALMDEDANVRKPTVDLLAQVETDKGRLTAVLEEVAESDPNENVRSAARWWLDKGR